MKQTRRVSLVVLLMLALCAPVAPQRASRADLRAIRQYIKRGWRTLERGPAQLAVAAVDPKFPVAFDAPLPVYISRTESPERIAMLLHTQMSPGAYLHIQLRQLPANTDEIQAQGLLYLPHPYVVPGGRFNEMYGWDSFFIILGLLRNDELPLAKGMVENFFFEIDNYGAVLNANRTYFLTRSQPPLLSSMIMAVYAAQ